MILKRLIFRERIAIFKNNTFVYKRQVTRLEEDNSQYKAKAIMYASSHLLPSWSVNNVIIMISIYISGKGNT